MAATHPQIQAYMITHAMCRQCLLTEKQMLPFESLTGHKQMNWSNRDNPRESKRTDTWDTIKNRHQHPQDRSCESSLQMMAWNAASTETKASKS